MFLTENEIGLVWYALSVALPYIRDEPSIGNNVKEDFERLNNRVTEFNATGSIKFSKDWNYVQINAEFDNGTFYPCYLRIDDITSISRKGNGRYVLVLNADKYIWISEHQGEKLTEYLMNRYDES